ncbi:P-loop containing nucleoside triphosphate hydrolase superfamily protein [Trifolium repens]|nr:P-loop containing nucleoside triphosphate hydrolase superfamily protein [Trifolium repens]
MFPILLDYQPLFTEFELFVEAIDNKHELALSGHQQFPGVYALLFCKRSVRSVGYRLAGSMGKVRRAADLDPLQPLLKKFIGCLEADALPLVMETSAPRTPMDRMSLWIGIKSLLGFLDPPAFEEGILENYPFFLDIVLNHISGDSLEFSHAVTCLRILFEMLGCKLWLSSTLSPSVMRNTLLGQCFHIRNEKIHKDIFGLFQPFLQSLEALHDGEHKKQRRHFLYFLLHQVPVSSNFSILTRKLACQIALLIVHRGYKMNPPCPPFECAHMWGPSLVSSLKDSSLHSSLRQPAFDLIQTIIVSDTAALIYSVLNCSTTRSIDSSMSCDILKLDDESDDIWLPSIPDGEEQDRRSSWSEFIMQSEIASQECREWMCIPMLWVDVLVDTSPSILPLSFSKAVFWARTRFPMVELESSAEMMLPVRSCPSYFAAEISSSFGWKVPTGSDDGGDGNKSKNSVEVLTMSFPLIRTFNRFTTHFLVQMRQGELRSQWIWEPVMSQSLILSLLDPNDDVRQFGKSMLEQVSETRGLSCGLKFLCSYRPSLVATILGLKHAMKLVQLDTVLLKFHTSHHFWFLLCKLLKDEGVLGPELPGRTHFDSRVPQFSSQGGFLMQPAFDSLPVDIDKHVIDVELQIKEKFSCLLSEMAWPVFCRCLVKGKEFIDYNFCQMTCVRLLEILPVLVDKLCLFGGKEHRNFTMLVKNKMGFKWIHNFMEWGKSSLKVVIVYWKRALSYLLNLFKGSCNKTSASTIMTIENLITSNSYALEELTEQVSRLSMSLSSEDSHDFQEGNVKLKSLVSNSLPFENNFLSSDIHSSSMEDKGLQILDFEVMTGKKDTETIVILSDDEVEPTVLSNSILSVSETGQNISDGNIMPHTAGNSLPASDRAIQNVSYMKTSKETEKTFQKKDTTDVFSLSSQKRVSGNLHNKLAVTPYIDSKGPESCKREVISKSKDRVNLIKSSVETVSTKILNKTCSNIASKTSETVSSTGNKILSDLRDSEDDPLETALKSVGRTQLYVPKPTSILKRQVIQLKNTLDSRSTCLNKVEDPMRRFKPPSLDDWYKPILEIDYFAIVGLASARKDESRAVNKLKEVPVCFQSAEQYVEIFRPLVLEEFKAQLQNSFLEMSSWEDMFYGSLSVMSVERIDDFHIVRFVHDDGDTATCRSFSENDIVLLTKDPPQKSNHDVHMVGKVERREKDYKRSISIVFIRFYFQNGSSRLNQARRNLTERSKWHGCRIMSITPQIREFHALSSVKHIPLLPLILNPVKDSFCLDECKEPDLSKLCQSLQQTLRSSFNVTQLQAISVAIGRVKPKKTVELSLIQGPPGTGKTRTIVAIVSALLASPHKTNGLKNPLYETTSQNSSTYSRPKINQSAAIARAWQDAAMARQLNDDVQSSSKSSENCARQRILICAQSNAAVDELVSRISSHGLYGSNGKMYKPYLVRVGNAKTVHPNSLPFFIDTIVDQRVAEEVMHSKDGKNDLRVDSSAMLRSNLEKLADSIRFYETKRANLRDGDSDVKNGMGGKTEMSDAEIEMKLGKLYEQKRQIYKDLRNVQAQEKKANEETKTLRNKLRKSILMEAQIVVTTLSGCGGDLYGVCSERMLCSKFRGPSEHTLFDAVVIDEAAQALEPATLIPLQLLKSSGTQCIMVGDPKQLPATVLSTVASKFHYECSMFERLQRAGHPVIMLTEQYRMHPEICKFPSLHFYNNKLLNGSQMSSKSAPFHQTKGLGPYAFYDIIDGREAHGKNSGAMSLCNEHEADAAVEILRFFKKRYPAEFIGGRIGIITPYKCQLSLLRSRFLNAFGSSTIADMEFNTVDGFQGREVDILLLSTVRAAHSSSAVSEINSSSIGFVADIRRMNVALTRAKISLWILGNARTLQTNHNWAALVKDAKERNLIMTAKMPYHSMFKTAKSKCVFENSDNHARPLKHEKVKDCGHKVPKKLVNDNDTQVRKNKCVSEVKDMDMGSHDEKKISVLEKIALAKERDSKNKHISMKKDTPCVAGGREGKYKMKISLGKTPPNKGQSKFKNSRNGLNLPVEKTSGGHKASKPSESEKPAMYSRGDMSSSAEVTVSSTKESHKESDANNQGRASNQSMDAEISKRKQQREAVDAILNSCLISTKKDERSTKVSAKRSFSSSVANGSMKPPKKKRV